MKQNNISKTYLFKISAMLIITSLAFSLSARGKDPYGSHHGGGYYGKNRNHENFEAMFSELDTDNDQSISKEEFNNRQSKFFNEMDMDNDSKVSESEFIEEGMRKGNLMAEIRRDKFSDKDQERITDYSKKMFSERDNNKDNFLNKEEFFPSKNHDRIFDRMDDNNDGMISSDEMKINFKKMKRYNKYQNKKRNKDWY